MGSRFKQLCCKISLIFFAFIFVNCEQVIDLPISNFEPGIVIFGVLEPDSVPKIFVSESVAYYTYVDTELENALIEDAQVEISDGKQSWLLQPDTITYLPPNDFYRQSSLRYQYLSKKPFLAYAFTTNITLQAGVTYEVSVRKNGNIAKAQCTVLSPLKLTLSKRPFFSTDKVYDVNYHVSNIPYGQYYRTLFAFNAKAYFCNGFEAFDPFELYYYHMNNHHQFNEDSLYIRPVYFFNRCPSNNNCPISFAEPADSIPVKVSIQLIDSNIINYQTQLTYQQEIENRPLSEPAPVDHQVENGLGILTSVATSKWETFWVKCQ